MSMSACDGLAVTLLALAILVPVALQGGIASAIQVTWEEAGSRPNSLVNLIVDWGAAAVHMIVVLWIILRLLVIGSSFGR